MVKSLIEAIIFSIWGGAFWSLFFLYLRNLRTSPHYPFQIALSLWVLLRPHLLDFFFLTALIFQHPIRFAYLWCLLPSRPPPYTLSALHQWYQSATKAEIFVFCSPVSSTVLWMERRCSACLLNGQSLGFLFVVLLCAYFLMWQSSSFSNFLRKGACEIDIFRRL